MAGQLVDLASKYPERFGNSGFLRRWPYAPPSLLTCVFVFLSMAWVFFFLEEVRTKYPTFLSKLSLRKAALEVVSNQPLTDYD